MDEHTHVNRPPLPFPLQHALAQTVVAPDLAQEAAVLMILWSGQRAGLCRWMEATEFMTQLIAEAETVFSKYWEAVSFARETGDEDEP